MTTDRSGKPVRLTCDGMADPLGVDHPYPLLAYIPGCRQQAVRFVILRAEGSDPPVYDSGWRKTSLCQHQPEQPLESRTAYVWYAEVRDMAGNLHRSDPAWLETGIFSGQFQARFIRGGTLFRREFAVEGEIETARLWFTALGYGELTLNGRRIGEERLFPSYTAYHKRVEYTVYDVTRQLRQGANAVGIWAAPHWPGGGQWMGRYYGGEPMAFLQLEIRYADGRRHTILSDGDFAVSASPVTETSIYNGERYDARQEQPGWDQPGFDAAGWAPARTAGADWKPRLVFSSIPPIRVTEEIPPVALTETAEGCLADFGVNFSGVARVEAEGRAGEALELRHAELLDPNGGLNRKNLRSAEARDRYIFAADGTVSYAPRFTYHGFRYAEISGVPMRRIRRITGLQLHTDVRQTGSFSCSDPLLNRIHEAMTRSMRTNLHSIPTDCCQRDERQGWLGDGLAASHGTVFNYDMQPVYRKWLEDIADAATPEGDIPTVLAPGEGGESFTWRAAYPVILRQLYEVYGDRQAVLRHYPVIRRFLCYLESREGPEGLLTGEDFGDWLAIESVPPAMVRDAFYVDAWDALALFAAVAGDHPGRRKAEEKRDRLRRIYQATYYSQGGVDTGYYGCNNQLGALPGILALLFGITPPEQRERVLEKVRFQLAESRGTPQLPTGIIGTPYVFLLLAQLGLDELALELMCRREYPSFGFMIDRGATTVWERWQWMTGYEMNSHNHSPLTGADGFFYRVLGGIRELRQPVEGPPVLRLEPYIPDCLEYVDCRYASAWGDIALRWDRQRGEIHLTAEAPDAVEAFLKVRGQVYSLENGRAELCL